MSIEGTLEKKELEQLERLHSEDTPAASWLPIPLSHIGSQVKRRQSQIFEFWNKHYTWHTFWSCLIRCANMKWIPSVLLKIQSGHDSVHRQTNGQMDGQGETSIPPFQLRWSWGYNNHNILKWLNTWPWAISSEQTHKLHPYGWAIRLKLWAVYLLIYSWTKWPPFHRQHFQMHFPKWKSLNFD